MRIVHAFPVLAALFTQLLTAQSPAWLTPLLPADAKVIETAAVRGLHGRSRMLVLWLTSPRKVTRATPYEYCGDSVYGDYWLGLGHLTLVNPTTRHVMNTIEITPGAGSAVEPEGALQLPFQVSDSYYRVLHPGKDKEGTPTILYLRDLTGEGVAGQFVLFDYMACGIASNSALGYSPRSDSAVQYRLESPLDQNGNPRWEANIFASTPKRPGHWDFTWDPGHGCFCTIHARLDFDPVRQVFINSSQAIPYPEELMNYRPGPGRKK